LLAGGLCNRTIAARNRSPGPEGFCDLGTGIATDFTAPSTAALARIPDLRATQYWDRKRSLSHMLGEHDRATVVWDYIAVYPPQTLWQDAPPKPVYSGHPVRDVIGGTKDAIRRLLAGGTNTGRE
jgi:hypothetical protein